MGLRQCVDRAEHISGEIKAARSVLAECAKVEDEQGRLYGIARDATMAAERRLDALIAERETLAHEAHSAIMAKGEPVPLADESGPNVEVEVIGVIPPNAPPTIRVDAAEDNAAVILDGAGEPVGYLGLALSVDEAREQLAEARLNDAFDRATHPQDDTGQPNGAF